MKAALILLSLFFLMVTFRARAMDSDGQNLDVEIQELLSTNEKLASQINTRNLPIRQYLSFGIYKDSCEKLSTVYLQLKSTSEDSLESSELLARHLKSCRRGVDGLAFLYSQQKI